MTFLAAASASARADVPPPGVDEPWQIGVTADQKERARTALDAGNALFVQNLYREAIAAYREGLAQWNHPAIRFNLAKALIALDSPVEALAELDDAMQYGAKPLGDVWSEAVNYRLLLHQQVGSLTVRCDQPGVAVLVDNAALAPCPTAAVSRVRPGHHTIVGRARGLLTFTRDETVIGGSASTIDVHLVSLRDATITRTRWATWKPWVVFGAGLAVAAAGVPVELDARGKLDDYRAALTSECGDLGCAGGKVTPRTAALDDQAHSLDRFGVGMMIAGGVGVAVGAALLVLNRPHSEIPRDEITLVPFVGAQASGAGGSVVGLTLTGHL